MRILKAIFHFYIEGSIHVSLAICALAGITVLTYGLEWEWLVFAFLFLSSITGYNFVKYAGIAKLHHRSLTNQLKTIQVFSLICFVLLIYVAFQQSWAFIETTAILGVVTLLYAVPFLPSKKNLRSLKSLKIFVIGFVWAGATLWLPLVDQLGEGERLLNASTLLNTLSYFLLVLALILPFEIRDLDYDNAELGTLPQRFGVGKTKVFGYIMLTAFVVLNILAPVFSTKDIIICIGIAILVACYIFFSTKKQNPHYCSFWVEATPIIWILLLWLT